MTLVLLLDAVVLLIAALIHLRHLRYKREYAGQLFEGAERLPLGAVGAIGYVAKGKR